MTFTAQELNTKITFQRLEEVVDPDTGYREQAWNTYGAAFAKVEPLVGREYLAAAAIQSQDNIKVTLRFRDGITTADRLLIRGQAWDVLSIQNIKFRNRELLLYCKRNATADPPPETYYLLTASGDYLTTADGRRLTWK